MDMYEFIHPVSFERYYYNVKLPPMSESKYYKINDWVENYQNKDNDIVLSSGAMNGYYEMVYVVYHFKYKEDMLIFKLRWC